MMEEVTTTPDDSYDSLDEQMMDRPKERWAPLGAIASPPHMQAQESSHVDAYQQLQKLEEEQEQLNTSLLALTTHFAQVQFRLKQIVSASQDEKEVLLKELESFAFQGCPDVRGCTSQDAQILEDCSDKERESKIGEKREKQVELISQLKKQLDDLETYAYKEGTGGIPQNTVLEKQTIILEELKEKLDLNLEDFDKLSTEDLKRTVDAAVGKIVNPAKVKEMVIDQLKSQIGDLERFISFLQGEATSPGPLGNENCDCAVHGGKGKEDGVSDDSPECCISPQIHNGDTDKSREKNIRVLKRALTVLQLVAVTQFGCGASKLRENPPPDKNTEKGCEELLKRLEKAVDYVYELARVHLHEAPPSDNDYTSDSEETPWTRPLDEVTIGVRRKLAPALRDLFQHGLMKMSRNRSVMLPISCLVPRASKVSTKIHAWEVLVEYYEMKNGLRYTSSPARKLSQSFKLDIIGGAAITGKQTLLTAIDSVRASHEPLKRSLDSQFKAFVCEGLNEHKLATWCRLLARTPSIIDMHYTSWSYMQKTGFEKAIQQLDRLTPLNFYLPSDLAIRQFHNIRDAF
ncbi:RUN domain-containing protein 1-like [Saccoglossus kowalevskii]|uniref:RUN domain-containing protein 1-like n=1 Tax=Saccoglossus kowalevskii TaxID=10224 RepID=A0ABM0M3Y3_SACKO|nr:PREDICTED: RUN domain-containing protein 1-like [Saccoglossus kowalevskii]